MPDAFDGEDAALIRALAGQAAIAITNARLIDELERSREENAQRADAERTLREIAVRVSSILDPDTVLTRIVAESARLLGSDGARIDLWDEELGALRWAYASGDAMSEVPEWGRTGGLKPRQAVAGLAFAEQKPIMTQDYLADDRFETTPEIEAFVRKAGIRAVIGVPLTGEGDAPLGVLSVVSREPGAYTETEVELLTALATHASIAITNANLMEQLARSRQDIERRAEAEASLRQIAARITALREPDEVLQHVVDEARRLLRADGGLIDQYDPESGTLQWAYDAGLEPEQREAVKMTNLRLGEGVSGKAVAEARVIHAGDYLAGRFPPRRPRRFARRAGRRPRPDRGADHRRGRPPRRDRGAEPPAERLRRPRRGRARKPGRAGGHRDHERPADRRAGAVPSGPRSPGRDRAVAA